MLRLADLEITRHLFLPDPLCEECGGLPDDAPADAAIPRVTRPKPDPAVPRVRDLRAERAVLEARYADDETGVLKGLRSRGLHTLPFAEAKVGPPESVDGGYGRALDFRTARVTAIAEALERLPGFRRLLHRYVLVQHGQVARTAACNGRHDIPQRLARWLLMAHDRAGADTYPMTHEFLSMMLGVRRAGISVAAGTLQKAGLIRYTAGKITIADRAGLENASCECYGVTRRANERLFGLGQNRTPYRR